MDGLGERLLAAHNAASVNLAVLASRTHYGKPYLSRLGSETRPVLPDHVTAYSRRLNTAIAAAGRRIGESLVEELEQQNIHLSGVARR